MSLDESMDMAEKTANPKLNTSSQKIPLMSMHASNPLVTFNDKQTLNHDHEESEEQDTG